MHADWLIPDWPAPANVRAVFTSRQGGVSSLPFDSMNLADHVGDLPEKVAANRTVLQTAIGSRAVFLQQVHGCDVLALDDSSADGQPADACVTAQRRLACTIMVADCLPLLLTTLDGSVVAGAHAGWRGLAGVGSLGETGGKGVIASVYESFHALAHTERAQEAIKTIAWLGPCIGPSAFVVGAEVKAAFMAAQPGASVAFITAGPGKFLADLAALARLRLQALGITEVYGNDGSAPWCTVSNPSRFFSHRRDAGRGVSGPGNGFGTTGRMAACIWRE